MPTTWTKNKFSNLFKIKHGYAFRGEYFSDVPTINILLTPGNFAIGGGFQSTKMKYYDGPIPQEYVLKSGDLIVTMTDLSKQGDTLGYPAVIPDNSNYKYLHNQRIGLIERKSNDIDLKYLFYLMRTNTYQRFVVGSASGATVKHTSPDRICNYEVNIPDNTTQSKIASVLSAYDDLIENDEKRIKTLEEMAQNIYTEWFVKFKFPAYEKVKMVDSKTSYGMIPAEWEVKKLKQIGKVITGKTPPTSNLENFNGEVLFIKTPDIHSNIFILETEQNLSEIGSNTQTLKLLPEKTVIVSCIGTLGVVSITSKPSQTNQQINALILNDISDYCFYYIFAKGLKQQLAGLGSNGATMGNVNKDKFENIKIIYPSEEIRKVFFNITSNLFDEILLLQKQNKNLSKTRDLLIPQLVTGKRELKN